MASSFETSSNIAGGGAQSISRAFLAAVSLLILADVFFLAAFAEGVFDTHHWFDEDGPIEDLQALVLAVAAVLAFRQARKQSWEGRSIGFGLAAMFLASCVRELEFRGTVMPESITWFFYGAGQNITIVAIFSAFLVWYLRRFRDLPDVIRALLQPRTLIYLTAGGILFLSGIAEASEERFGNPAEVLEEWLELNGYILFLAAVSIFPYRDRRPDAGSPR